MNKMLKTTVYLILLSLSSQLIAQQKIAVIHKDSIINTLYTFYAIDSIIGIYEDSLMNNLENLQNELSETYDSLVRSMGCGTPKQEQDAQIILKGLQDNLDNKTLKAEELLQAKEKGMTVPILQYLDKVIYNIGWEQNYDLIIDSSDDPSILYLHNTLRLDNKIIQVFKSTYAHE